MTYKMKKKSIIKLACLSIIALACNKNEILNPNSLMNEECVYFKRTEAPVFTTAHDIQLNDFARSLNQAVRANTGMRKFIHSEALLRFDGDYDFLIKQAIDKPVDATDEFIATRSATSALTFGEIIRDYLPDTKSDTDFLTELQKQYPNLQVAVPVHAEDWDPETYIPAVVFEPEDYDDAITTVVPGYDSDGHFIEVDAVNIPDVPVIVISHNEGIPDRVPRPFVEPEIMFSSPTNLTASATNNGIVLSWVYLGDGVGYQVWRKGLGDTQFVQIATLHGLTNCGYQDTQVNAGATYQYYVRAFDLNAVSLPSEQVTVVAPSSVSPLSSFRVLPSGLQIECEWTHGQTDYADVVIEHKGPNDAAYSVLNRTTNWNTNYCFTPSDRGKRHNFRAYRDNGSSLSSALTDYIYPPFRNTNAASYVYLKKIEYPRGLEGWLRGDAEFDIVVTYYNTVTNSIQVDSLFLRRPPGQI